MALPALPDFNAGRAILRITEFPVEMNFVGNPCFLIKTINPSEHSDSLHHREFARNRRLRHHMLSACLMERLFCRRHFVTQVPRWLQLNQQPLLCVTFPRAQ